MKQLIYRVFLSFMILFGGPFAVFGQRTARSVMIYNVSTGTEESAVGGRFEQSLIRTLADKYPCVDWMNPPVLAATLESMRQHELLSGELDQKVLAEYGEMVGDGYIVIVRVLTMGGQKVISARVIDGKSAQMVADRMENAATGDASYKAAESVAQKILQDISSSLGNQCDAHWTGTITYSQKTLNDKNEKIDVGWTKGNVISSEKFDETVQVTLQAMGKGGKVYFYTSGHDSMILSGVTRKYTYHREKNTTETGEVVCRPRGANSYRKPITSTEKIIRDEQAEATETVPVEIKVLTTTGGFEIKVPTPGLLIKMTEVRSGVKDDCAPKPFSENKSDERADDKSFFRFEGQIDPKNPDILVGQKVTGTLETKQHTITWNLRLVQPNKKR